MWTLRRKILGGYALGIALAAVVLGLAITNIVRLGRASDDILQENYRSILAAEEMLNALAEQEHAAMQLVLGLEPQALRQFSHAEQRFLTWLDRAKNNITIQGEPEILERIERQYSDFLLELARFRTAYLGDRDAGLRHYRQELAPRAEAVRQAARDLHELNRRTMEASSRRAQQIAGTAVWSMLAAGVIVFGAAIVFSVWLAGRIVRPVRRLSEATEQVAAGNYDVRIEPESHDEVGQLAQKFGVMLAKLRAYHELNLRRIVGEQRKAEAILKTIDDGVLVVGAEGTVTSLNPTAARALEIPYRDVEGHPFAETIRDERLRTLIGDALKSGSIPRADPSQNYLSLRLTDTRELHFEYTLTTIAGEDSRPMGVVVLLRNVTALKELDRLKTEFVMTASHELRSPLTSIAMSIELLRERAAAGLNTTDRELLDVAHEELERLRALVDELLDLSRMQSGKLELEFTSVAVPAVLEAAIAPFRAQAEEQSIDLTVKVKDPTLSIEADPNKLTWVVTNLIGNALRYARGRIEVSAERAGPWVNLYVLDDGPGVAYEDQARIFEKFVQVGDGKRPGGAGLGLAISREIVKAHRGNIWVESEPGRGSLFIIALPGGRTSAREPTPCNAESSLSTTKRTSG